MTDDLQTKLDMAFDALEQQAHAMIEVHYEEMKRMWRVGFILGLTFGCVFTFTLFKILT